MPAEPANTVPGAVKITPDEAAAVFARHAQRPEGGKTIHCFSGSLITGYSKNWPTLQATALAAAADVAMWNPADVAGHCLWIWHGGEIYRFQFAMPAQPAPPARVPVETIMVPQYGVTLDGVWIPAGMLEELSEQGPWDSQAGDAYIRPAPDQGRVLVARGLAVRETRGGYHRGPQLEAFMQSLEWPQEREPAAGQPGQFVMVTEDGRIPGTIQAFWLDDGDARNLVTELKARASARTAVLDQLTRDAAGTGTAASEQEA